MKNVKLMTDRVLKFPTRYLPPFLSYSENPGGGETESAPPPKWSACSVCKKMLVEVAGDFKMVLASKLLSLKWPCEFHICIKPPMLLLLYDIRWKPMSTTPRTSARYIGKRSYILALTIKMLPPFHLCFSITLDPRHARNRPAPASGNSARPLS